MALARAFTNPRDGFDMHMATAVGNKARPLQFSGHLGNAGPSDAHHLREKFLGKRQVGADKVVHSEQPPAHPRMNVVNRITSSGLLDLRQEELLIFDEKCPEIGDRAKHLALMKFGNGKVRLEGIDIPDAKTREKAVVRMGHVVPSGPAGGSTTGLSATDAYGTNSLGR